MSKLSVARTKRIELSLRDLDLSKIKHITVTPHFYEILKKKYGQKWVEGHCSINVPNKRVLARKIYVTEAGKRLLKKIRLDK